MKKLSKKTQKKVNKILENLKNDVDHVVVDFNKKSKFSARMMRDYGPFIEKNQTNIKKWSKKFTSVINSLMIVDKNILSNKKIALKIIKIEPMSYFFLDEKLLKDFDIITAFLSKTNIKNITFLEEYITFLSETKISLLYNLKIQQLFLNLNISIYDKLKDVVDNKIEEKMIIKAIKNGTRVYNIPNDFANNHNVLVETLYYNLTMTGHIAFGYIYDLRFYLKLLKRFENKLEEEKKSIINYVEKSITEPKEIKKSGYLIADVLNMYKVQLDYSNINTLKQTLKIAIKKIYKKKYTNIDDLYIGMLMDDKTVFNKVSKKLKNNFYFEIMGNFSYKIPLSDEYKSNTNKAAQLLTSYVKREKKEEIFKKLNEEVKKNKIIQKIMSNDKENLREEIIKRVEEAEKYHKNYVNLNDIDVSHIVDMTSLFENLEFNGIIDISKWNTKSVLFMVGMFENSNIAYIKGLDNLNTKNVIAFHYMFKNAKLYQKIDNWNMGKALVVTSMFKDTKFKKVKNKLDILKMFNKNLKYFKKNKTIGLKIYC